MQWTLKKFVKEYGAVKAGIAWGKTHQAVQNALKAKRNITIELVNGYYDTSEHKRIGRVKSSKVKL